MRLRAKKETERIGSFTCNCGCHHFIYTRIFYQRRRPQVQVVRYEERQTENGREITGERVIANLCCKQFFRAVEKMSAYVRHRIYED